MTADPRLASEAACLAQVSFAEASEMASFGARVLHPASVSPAVSANIPVRVLNSRKPDQAGTVVLERPDPTHRGIISLASRAGLTVVFLEANRAMGGDAFRRQVMDGLGGFTLLPDLVQVSAVGGLAVYRDAGAAAAQARGWAELGQARVVEDAGLVAAVGERLREDQALQGEVCGEMGGLEPLALAAGGTAISVYAIYPQARLERVVQRLHRRFFLEVSRT
jgi:aspartokinase